MTEHLNYCILEWDKSRGVLYVHNYSNGNTILRICGLDKTQKGSFLDSGMIDITIRPKDFISNMKQNFNIAKISYPQET